VLYRAAVCMNLDDTSLVQRTAVEKAATEWAHRKFLNAMASSPDSTEKEFRYITCRWLRFAAGRAESTTAGRRCLCGKPLQQRPPPFYCTNRWLADGRNIFLWLPGS
jgi:hypothetical protein